jgi:ABC-type phosphate transport system substrate-binding protein
MQNVPENVDFVCAECKRPLAPVGPTESGRPSQLLPLLLILGILLLLVGIGAYLFSHLKHGPPTTTTESGRTSTTPTNSAPLLRLCGSNTIGSQLGPDRVQGWLTAQGASDIRPANTGTDESTITSTMRGAPVAIQIKAHGSATAFTDLAAGACDIGMASRKIKSPEAAELQAKGLGDLTSNVNERVVGLDGVAVIANEANSKDTMTKNEVADIFSGTSSGQAWNIYARDNKSGTYDTFKDRVLDNRSLTPNAKRFEDSRALATAVAQDRNGIGFVGLPYAVGVKALAIGEKGTTPLTPNTMTVRTKRIPSAVGFTFMFRITPSQRRATSCGSRFPLQDRTLSKRTASSDKKLTS